ncbi:MAG: hypothetical protein DCO97_11545 [Marivita sp. XM-24bin2]|nr:MAG: hypothetical protein DCO97_11545 [Marivita sp. XM-24bin2]
MSEYFSTLVSRSLALVNSPADLSADVSAEVLSLAVRIKANQELRQKLEELLEDEANKAEIAGSALSILESSFDPRRESAHFSPAIYAAI